MSFASLLIHTCNIQTKSRTRDGHEVVDGWTNTLTGVACRHNGKTTAKIADAGIRVNTDDDIFFFTSAIAVARGQRIVYDGANYDVIKVNKVAGRAAAHHKEVIARYTDHA